MGLYYNYNVAAQPHCSLVVVAIVVGGLSGTITIRAHTL